MASGLWMKSNIGRPDTKMASLRHQRSFHFAQWQTAVQPSTIVHRQRVKELGPMSSENLRMAVVDSRAEYLK
jgi:hypothetical protein